jgi:hypothetical protein
MDWNEGVKAAETDAKHDCPATAPREKTMSEPKGMRTT